VTEREQALERARQAQQELLKRNQGLQGFQPGAQGLGRLIGQSPASQLGQGVMQGSREQVGTAAYPGSGNRASLKSVAREFTDLYGLELQPKLEGSPFAFHDGAHKVVNAPATIYGELLQNAADKAAFGELYNSGTIQGNPASYLPEELLELRRRDGERLRSSFVNYGLMPERQDYESYKKRSIEQGADPQAFERGSDTWQQQVLYRVNEQEGDLNSVIKVANKRFKKGDQAFFQGSGGWNPEEGFMPSPDLRNPQRVDPGDMNIAKSRGKAFAQDLVRGYREAVKSGEYKPTRPVLGGAIHAADLSDAAMSGTLQVGRGWQDESIFPYADRINQLSNPPARISAAPGGLEYDLELANKARRGRAVDRVSGAIRTGANVTTDIAGSVPLFDPEFRQAVEQGRPGAAAGMVAKDYAIGTAAAPVVGAGAGVLQRAAPKAAARVLPAVAGATRVGNPVAVVSQIGGDSRQSQAQVVAAQQAAERQLNRAREARQRGGKWGIGPLRLPELGISEAGGLLFGGNKSGRQIGTRAVLGGKPVVWTGDNYGWQSPASAAKVGVR
jgi:hypothetical protein